MRYELADWQLTPEGAVIHFGKERPSSPTFISATNGPEARRATRWLRTRWMRPWRGCQGARTRTGRSPDRCRRPGRVAAAVPAHRRGCFCACANGWPGARSELASRRREPRPQSYAAVGKRLTADGACCRDVHCGGLDGRSRPRADPRRTDHFGSSSSRAARRENDRAVLPGRAAADRVAGLFAERRGCRRRHGVSAQKLVDRSAPVRRQYGLRTPGLRTTDRSAPANAAGRPADGTEIEVMSRAAEKEAAVRIDRTAAMIIGFDVRRSRRRRDQSHVRHVGTTTGTYVVC